jgi:hypothetical protein
VICVVLDANVLVSAALARDPAAPSVRAFDALLDGSRWSAVLPCSARSPRFWGATGFAAISRSTKLVGSWPTSPAS